MCAMFITAAQPRLEISAVGRAVRALGAKARTARPTLIGHCRLSIIKGVKDLSLHVLRGNCLN